MDYSQLDDLLKIPKKGDASKEKKETFSQNMSTLLSEEGYGINAEKYFFDGFSFCGAFPVFDFIKNFNDKDKFDFVTKIIKGEKYSKNEKGISLKALVHLLSLFIVGSSKDIDIIELLLRHIPYNAKTKENKVTKDFPSVLEKYFISEIKDDTTFPDFQMLVKEKEFLLGLSSLFSDGLKKINTKNADTLQNISKTLNWLNIKTTDDENSLESETQHGQSVHPNKQKLKENITINKLRRLKETLQNDISLFSDIVRFISELENDLSFVREEKKVIEEKYSQLQVANDILKSEKEKLQNNFNILRGLNVSYEKEISILKEEIEGKNSVLSIYSSDKQNSLNEQLNIIASKLKTHYLNYKDAVEMEMTAELGENIKNLMGEIFKTLAKSGVDVERKI